MKSLTVAITLITLLSANRSALAQNEDNTRSSGQHSTISLTFSGGNAEEYLETIRRNASKANIISEGDVALVNVAPLSLTSVTVEAALSLIDGMYQEQPNGGVKLDVSRISAGSAIAYPVYKVTARVESQRVSQTQLQSGVIALDRALDDEVKADDVLTAIDTALKLYGKEFSEPQIRYHRETQLLIVRAHPQQLDSIHSVVSELAEARKRAHTAAGKTADAEKLAGEVTQMRDELKRAQAQAESLRAETQQYQIQTKTLLDELESLRVQRDRTEMETQRRVADYMEEIAKLKVLLSRKDP